MAEKICRECKQSKDELLFGVANKETGRRLKICRVCANIYSKNWQAANPDKVKAKKHKYNISHRAELAAAARKYRAAKIAENAELYYATRREKQRARYARDPAFRKYTHAHASKWARANPDKVANSLLKCTYGITREDYDKMLESKGGCCELCGYVKKEGERRFPVDHDHNTGKVRGILCNHCNTSLGAVKESPATLFNMIRYLNHHRPVTTSDYVI